jgi:hypothetical protein
METTKILSHDGQPVCWSNFGLQTFWTQSNCKTVMFCWGKDVVYPFGWLMCAISSQQMCVLKSTGLYFDFRIQYTHLWKAGMQTINLSVLFLLMSYFTSHMPSESNNCKHWHGNRNNKYFMQKLLKIFVVIIFPYFTVTSVLFCVFIAY